MNVPLILAMRIVIIFSFEQQASMIPQNKIPLYLFLVLCFIGSFQSIFAAPESPAEMRSDDVPLVVTSTPLLKHFVESVAGPQVEVFSIYHNNVDPHHFEPSPSHMKMIQNADLVIVHGLGYDDWTLQIPEIKSGQIKLLELGNFIDPIVGGEVCTDHGSHDHHHHDNAGYSDPHAWMNPKNVMIYVQKIESELKIVDRKNASNIEARSNLFQTKLKVLDSWIKRQMASVPHADRAILVDHNALSYFAEAYGIEVKSLAIDHYTEVDMKTFREITDWSQDRKVNVLLISSLREAESFNQIRSDLKLASVEKYFVDQMPDDSNSSYEEMMIQNTLAIVRALQ